MDIKSLARLTGQPTTLEVDGERYDVHPLSFGDLGSLQAWIDGRRADPFATLAAQLGTGRFSVAQEKHMMALALEQATRPGPPLGTPEADAMLNTLEGYAEVLYLTIRKGRPGFTREDASRLLAALGEGRLGQVRRTTDLDLVSDPKAPTPPGAGTTPAA